MCHAVGSVGERLTEESLAISSGSPGGVDTMYVISDTVYNPYCFYFFLFVLNDFIWVLCKTTKNFRALRALFHSLDSGKTMNQRGTIFL